MKGDADISAMVREARHHQSAVYGVRRKSVASRLGREDKVSEDTLCWSSPKANEVVSASPGTGPRRLQSPEVSSPEVQSVYAASNSPVLQYMEMASGLCVSQKLPQMFLC